MVSRVSSPVLPRPCASGGSADAPAHLRKRGSRGVEDGLFDSTGGNVTTTRVLPIEKASTPLASSLVVLPVGGGQVACRGKRRRKARMSLMRASLERSNWKDVAIRFILAVATRCESRRLGQVP